MPFLKTIAAGELKRSVWQLWMKCRPETKFVITKNGKPVAQMIPVEEIEDGLFGFYAGKLAISGDIEAPSVPPGHWKRLK